MMTKRILPSIDEIVFAISEQPLGKGTEATVYKIHVEPKFTVRVSNDAPDIETLSEMMYKQGFIEQKDIFGGRNYAQAIAYMGVDEDDPSKALASINLYSPGFSMQIYKAGGEEPSSNIAKSKTLTLSKAVANMPDSAFDKLYDDLHFLSSREYQIDTGAGFFTNTGNILYAAQGKKEFRIIDLQPFRRNAIGVNSKHKKGSNTPLCLAQGLVPGMSKYNDEHAKDPELIEYRTEIIDKIIRGAQRNNLNDLDGEVGKKIYKERLLGLGRTIKEPIWGGLDMGDVANIWRAQLNRLFIPEKYIEGFIKDICSVEQKDRYPLIKHDMTFVRVGHGRGS